MHTYFFFILLANSRASLRFSRSNCCRSCRSRFKISALTSRPVETDLSLPPIVVENTSSLLRVYPYYWPCCRPTRFTTNNALKRALQPFNTHTLLDFLSRPHTHTHATIQTGLSSTCQWPNQKWASLDIFFGWRNEKNKLGKDSLKNRHEMALSNS